MINLKAIFKQIYFLMIISEIIILIATGLIYFLKANRVTEKVLDQKRVLNIISRDSHIEYIAKKIRIIVEDELFILKTYLNILNWKIGSSENYTIKNATEETREGPWYLNSSDYKEYLHGIYFPYLCTDDDLPNLQKLSEFLEKLFEKYYKWKSKKYIDIEYLYITLKNGCFFKFPALKSGWAQPNYIPNDDETICPNRSPNEFFTPFENESLYDPRCRTFYSISVHSDDKITFTKPYKFTNGKWGSDICVRTELNNTGDENKAPDAVLCMVVNYFDFDVFREPKEENKDETELMIMHYQNSSDQNYDNLNILYDSYYFISELSCFQGDKKGCSPINFFDVYYKSILEHIYEYNPNEYEKKYLYLKNNKAYSNLEDYIINITNQKTQDLLQISIENFDSENGYYTQKQSAQFSNGEVSYTDHDEKIYVFPILSSFDYINTASDQFKIIDGNSDKSEFFLLIREKSSSKNDEKMRFLRVAITEIFLFLFYLLSFNTLIWFLFNFVYYYIIKGLTYSLKQIRNLYLLIISTVLNTNDDLNPKNNRLLNELGININNNSNDENKDEKEDKTIINYINEFINEYIIKSIHNLSQIENHKEIQQSFTTLKAIMIILLYNNNCSKSKSNNTTNYSSYNNDTKTGFANETTGMQTNNNNSNTNNNTLENNPQTQFTNVIQFFSECFYSSNSNKLKIDFSLVKMIIENIFISMLKEFNSLKTEFNENPTKIYNNLYKKLNQIDDYYILTKQAITNSHNELLVKNSNGKKNQDKRSDLLLLSLLEENLNYLYCIHKCTLIDGLLSDKINENINVGENIDEEEKALFEKLQKKERKMGKNKPLKEKNQIIENKDELLFNKDGKLKFNFTSIKFNEDFTCNEETKIYIQAIIKYCEDYLEIKDVNKKNIKKINKNYNQNTIYSSTMNNITLKTNDPFIKYNRVDEILSEFKVIFIYLGISLYHILCDEGQKSFTCYENALNKFHDFEKLIEKYKSRSKSEWKLTNFTMFFINSIFYEKILVIFSFLCHKFAQYKTELFINLNILDFSPLYSLTTRKLTITKVMQYIYNLRKYLVQKANDNFSSYKLLITNDNYVDIQKAIYKLICLRNIVSKEVKKKVLFVFDLDNKYIKDTVFKEIMFSYFKNYSEEIKSNNFDFYFCAFDNKLHLQFEPDFSEEVTMGRKYVKNNYLVVINKPNNIQLNNRLSIVESNDMTNPLSNNSSSNNLPLLNYKKNNMNDNANTTFDKLEEFFKFIKNYKGDKNIYEKEQKGKPHRADKALYHAAIFGFENENDPTSISKLFKKNKYSKYSTTSYLILMTNLSSTFTNNQYNWKEMSEVLYEKKISVIVVISYDPSFDSNIMLKEKISYYTKFLETNMINGHLFIMRSLTLLKFILNAIFPIKFSKFNIDILRHYLCSNEDINLSRRNKNK